MKRKFIIRLATFITLLYTATASAHDIAVKNSDGDIIYYKVVSKNKCAVTYKGYRGESQYKGNISIPSYIIYNGQRYDVIEIGEYAFYGSSALKSVIIPNGIKVIRDGAFCYCENLCEVTIPQSVIEVETDAFYSCSNLKSVCLLNPNIYVNNRAFQNCKGIKEISCNNEVTKSRLENIIRLRHSNCVIAYLFPFL